MAFFTIDGIYNLAGAPTGSSPGPQTPTSMFMTLNSVKISGDARQQYKTIFDVPTKIDVVGHTGLPGSVFGKGTPPIATYKAVRFELKATGQYIGTNPCTGIDVTNPDGDVIELPGKENENDASVTINYMVPHPVLGLQTGFLLMQSLKVGLTPVDLRLVFTASHSVVCASSEPPLRALSGDLTLMDRPLGVALDPIHDEIALVNSDPAHTRITFYRRLDNGDPQPVRPPLEGAATGLDIPIGVYMDTVHDEIGVTNNGNNSVTIYNRTDSGNSSPIHLPLIGDKTGLNSPGMPAFYSDPSDHANDEILVTNAGNESITVYNRDQVVNSLDGNVAPMRTIGRDFVVTLNTNDVINLTETGGAGNVNATILAGRYGSGTELAAAVETALNNAVTSGTSFTVTYDDISGHFIITVTALGFGVSSVTLNWDDAASTSRGVLGFHPVSSGSLFSNSRITSDFGDLTGLGAPCGIYVDPVNNEIGVANNGNSITFYDWSGNGNITPKRTISGPRTDLNGPCGISLYLDPGGDSSKDEIIVANFDNSVRIYSRMANGNVPPLRTIRGTPTELSKPVGIALYLDQSIPNDPAKDEIVVADSGHDAITIHKRYDNRVQLKSLPVMVPSGQQLTLFSQYSFSYPGTIDTPEGQTPSTSANFDGYRFVWEITDERIRQTQDASSAYLFPPGNSVFQLTDGEIVPYLPLDCTQITPFITLTLITNCPPAPLIHAPLPFSAGEYRVASVLFSEVKFTKFPMASNPLEASEFPRLRPTVKVSNNIIDEIDWNYTDEAGVDLPSPLIFSQQFQINLTQAIGDVLTCYKPVQGNNPHLVFDSGPILQSDRSVTYIKNNKCPIFFSDVGNITFTVTDALSNSYLFTLNPT